MTCGSEYAPQLHSRGFRVTSQRLAVLHVLRHSHGHLSPTEIYTRARRELPDLTETTVYRTLEFLARNNLAWSISTDNGHRLYEIASSSHDHLICRRCGRDVEIEHSLLKNVYAKAERASGYLLTDKHLALFGLCPECQKEKSTGGG